jgi:virginiamycin B lyase
MPIASKLRLPIAGVVLSGVVAAFVGVQRADSRPSAPPMTDITKAGATAIKAPGDWLAAGAGGVWLSDPPTRVIRRLDPTSGAAIATVRVPRGPCEAMDVGFGSVWTATCGRPGLTRIDTARNIVKGFVSLAIPASLDGEGSVGAGAGAVWAVVDGDACFACRVARVNPATFRVVATIPVHENSAAVRVGYGGVWVTNPAKGEVQKINPRTNRVVATTRVGPGPRFLDVAEGGVWILNQGNGSVARINPRSAKVVARIPAGVVGEGGDMTAGGGWAWARGTDILLTRIDPRTNAVVERYGPSSGSGAAIVGYGAVWVSAHDVETVWRLPLPAR